MLMEGDDHGSDWQSCDSAEDGDSEGSGDDPQAELTRTPNSKRTSCLGPWSTPDRQALHPAEPQLTSAASDHPLVRLSTSHSDLSIASSDLGSAPSILDRRFHRDDVAVRNVYLFAPPALTHTLRDSSMDQLSVSEICDRLGSDEDAVRKMAAFKLQSNVGDPSFAEMFILQGGLAKLKYLILKASGNTLAYSLASFSRLLEVDKGWECVEQDLIGRVRMRPSSRIQHY